MYNTFNSPNLVNYSPYGLVFERKPKILLNLDTTPDIKVLNRIVMINKDGAIFQYNSGDLVYIISPLTSHLCTASSKVMTKYVGLIVIYNIINPHNYLLMTLDGKSL